MTKQRSTHPRPEPSSAFSRLRLAFPPERACRKALVRLRVAILAAAAVESTVVGTAALCAVIRTKT